MLEFACLSNTKTSTGCGALYPDDACGAPYGCGYAGPRGVWYDSMGAVGWGVKGT